MKTEVCIYEGNAVAFSFDRERDMMVNATEMAKIFGRDVPDFTMLKQTKDFISECLKNHNYGFLGDVETEEDLIVSKQKSGTWMHRILALKFAAWLSPAFELWVYAVIDDLCYGRLVRREKSFERTMDAQRELEAILDKIEKTGEDFNRYLELQKQLKHEVTYRRSLTIEDLSGMKSLF
jgi:hypothetical protein